MRGTEFADLIRAVLSADDQEAAKNTFLGLLSQAPASDQIDPGDFGMIIAGAVNFGLKDTDFATQFGFHMNTIDRWQLGQSLPQPYVIPIVIGWVTERLGAVPVPA